MKISTLKKDNYVVLTIEDNGIGISEEDQMTIFNKEKRVSEDYEGTGMGQGKIEVNSQPGRGSVFQVTFKFDTEQNSSQHKVSI